jgi:hypothetical protein
MKLREKLADWLLGGFLWLVDKLSDEPEEKPLIIDGEPVEEKSEKR